MRKSEFYYRKYGTSEFIKSDAERKILVVAPKDKYHAEPLFWDADATPPEWKALSSFDDESVTTKDGEKIAGVTVEYFETEEIAERTRADGAALLSAFRRLCKTSDANGDAKASAKRLAAAASYFTAENFSELLTLQKKNRWNAYYAVKEKEKDDNGFERRNFACVFETDFDKLTLKFSCIFLDSASAKKYAAAEWFFDMENGLADTPGSGPESPALNKKFTRTKFPLKIMERNFDILKDLACRFTGKKLSFPPFQKLAEKNVPSSWYLRWYFFDIVQFPFCPILGSLDGWEGIKNFPLDREDGGILNKFFAFTGIPNLKSIRKVLVYDNRIAEVAYKLKAVGFTDHNCFNLAVKNLDFFEDLLNSGTTQYNRENEQNMAFFLKYALTKRKQISAMRTLLKTADMIVTPESIARDSLSIYTDALNMFSLYFNVMPDALKKAILRHGFNRKNHDALSLLAEKIGNNSSFIYTDEQRALEDKIGGYEFCLPADTKQLVEIGLEMHNCVGSYGGSVLRGNCTIVCAKKNGKYALCIEVRGNEVWQALAACNSEPDEEQDNALTLWRQKHGLQFDENEF